MASVDVKVKASGSAGSFRRLPLTLTDRWTTVDVRRPDVRRALVDYVGTHVRVHPSDVSRLADVGLVFKGDRLVEVTPEDVTPTASVTKREGQRKSAAA